jgi:phosphate transport system substrate-binding protein
MRETPVRLGRAADGFLRPDPNAIPIRMKTRLPPFRTVLFLGLAVLSSLPACGGAGAETETPRLILAVSPALQIPAQALAAAFRTVHPQGRPIEIRIAPFPDGTSPLEEIPSDGAIDWREPDPGKWSAVIGWTGIRVIVPPGNPLTNLTIDQVRRIFRGDAAHWEEIGGFSGAIHPISYSPGADEALLFERIALAGSRVAPGTVVVPDSRALADAVRADPLSIGFVLGFQPVEGAQWLEVDRVAPDFPAYLSGKYPLRIAIYLAAEEPVPEELLQFAGWAQSVAGQTVLLELHTQE